jgi:hypothetical protein
MSVYHNIVLKGHIPGGKGMYNRRRTSKTGAIDKLLWQATRQWSNELPLDNPAIRAKFFVVDGLEHLDSKWVTVSNLLIVAGVIKWDNINHLPGPITIEAVVGTVADEGVEIVLEVEAAP